MRNKYLFLRLTKEQDQLLDAYAKEQGYPNKSAYARAVLFKYKPLESKVEQIYQVVCRGRV